MKLRNVLLQWDLWIVCADDDNEVEIAKGIVRGGEPPNEEVRYAIQNERDLPNRVKQDKPFVSESISEEEYKPLVGSTIEEAWKRLYTKEPA